MEQLSRSNTESWRRSGCKLFNSKSDVGIIPSAKRGKEMNTLRLVKGALTMNFPLCESPQDTLLKGN